MTNESAHSYMENEIRCVQRASKGICTRDCSKCDLVREDKSLLEAYGLAVLALEKQIPKKFIHRKIEYDGAIFGIIHCECPTCRWTWNTMCNNEEHCIKCGQALDWSE